MLAPYDFSNLSHSGSVNAKLQDNIRAVKLLNQLKQENRQPTEPDRNILARFVGWGTVASAINRELIELLPECDLNSDNAFQTPRDVIEAIWEVVEHLGFKSGRILEPAANIGLFPGFQKPEYRRKSEWVLVEIDKSASAIAQYLHPDATVYGSTEETKIGFEHVELPYNSFDLAISNFPFGRTAPFDPNYVEFALTLHNYFWLRCFDLIAPGGIIAALTSVGTLDSTPEFCQYLASKGARLIGAVRLPNTAFRCMNTSVTADLIVIQKMDSPQDAQEWGELTNSGIADRDGSPLSINRYFADNPDMILGTLAPCTLYGSSRIAVSPDGRDLKQAIINAFSKLPPCYQPRQHTQGLQENLLPVELVGLDPYRYVEYRGKIYQYQPGNGLVRVTKHAKHIADGLKLKAALDKLVRAEIDDDPDVEELRQQLNQLHNEFIINYGRLLNRRDHPNSLEVFADDSELVTLCYALEEEIPAEIDLHTGKIKSVRYKKADIFTQRVSGKLRRSDRTINNAMDAVKMSLDRKGYLDLKLVSLLLDKTEDETIAALKEVETANGKQAFIFYDPQAQTWVMRDEYLSGDTRAKLQLVRTIKDIDSDGYNRFWLFDNEAELTKRDEKGRYLHLSPYLLPPASPFIRAEIAHRLKSISDIDSYLDASVYIDGGLGSGWIETEHIQEFAAHILSIPEKEVKCQHVPELGLWSVTGSSKAIVAAAKSEYASGGNSGRGARDVLWLLEQALNQRPIKIQVLDEKKEVDKAASEKATDAAIAQVERLKKKFKEWLWSDLERAYSLTAKYNRLYPMPQKRVFDGSYLTLPDSNSKIQLRSHQLNAVARAIQSKRLLALHECGTGKTFTMVAACYEAQRLGIATKPVIVAHNSTLSQVVNSFKRLYPNAKLLVADESSWKERNKLIAKIQTGRYHAIILTHSQFFGIPIKPTTKLRYINKQLELIEQYMEEASQEKDRSLFLELRRQNESLREQVAEITTLEKIRTTPSNSPEFGELIQNLLKEEVISIEENGRIEYVKPSHKPAKNNRNQKTLDKKRDTLSNSVEKATSYYSQNSINIFWEDLGCKWVWLDECHCAKNIVFATKTQGIAGITNTNTQRSLNTLLKYNWVFEEGGFIGGGTGTLPSNSITELYNIQRLFSPDILKETGTEHFDSWLAQYGEITTSLEFTSTGGIKPRTRVSSYKNIWELISSAALFTDFATADGVGIPRPALYRYTITAPMNETQLAITQTIKNWMELWQRKMPVSYAKPDGTIVEHNPLTLTSLGSLASIDPRLVEPNAPVHLDTKLTRLIHNVWHIWKASTPACGTQVIFCDSGVPNKAKGLFDCYNYIRDHLVALGVPRREIAFVHECKTDEERFDLYGKINAGVVRIAIASTEKGGTGADYPQRIVAMHHLDLSWTPASLVQRRGRGHRQGNLWFEVHEFVYGTAGANGSPGFDAYKLGLVKIKSELNYKFMTGDVQERHCEDVGEDASHYMIAAAILSGNNTALEHARIIRQIRQLSSDLSSLSSKLEEDLVSQKSLPGEIEKLRAMLADALSDVEHLRSLSLEQGLEQWIVEGVKYSKTKTAAKALMQAIYRIIQGNVPCFESKIGSVASLGIYANYLKGDWVQSVYLRSHNGSVYYDLSQHWETGTQLVRAIGHAIASIAQGTTVEQLTEELERREAEFNELPQRIENLTSEISRLHQELEPLLGREVELRKLLMEGQKDNGLSTQGASSKRVAAPSPASYTGADPEVVEYIKSLPIPTTTDAEGKLVSWIDAIEGAALKVRGKLQEVEGGNSVNRQKIVNTPSAAAQLPLLPISIPSKAIVGEQLALF